MLRHYVLGFAFSPDYARVALIRKRRPAWQAGYLNGIGGKLEAPERPVQAMVREFREETGAGTAPDDWRRLASLRFEGARVDVFETCRADLTSLDTMTDEPVIIIPSLPVPPDAIANLNWLIPLAIQGVDAPVRVRSAGREDVLAGLVQKAGCPAVVS